MHLSSMLAALQAVDLYHPQSHSTDTPFEVLVVTVIIVVFVAVVAGFATFARRREERREAE